MEAIWVKNKLFNIDGEYLDEVADILGRYQTQNAQIKQKFLKDLQGYAFYIKNYQRGYRWTSTEVEELLTDVDGLAENERYCLQPLVVTKAEDNKALCKLTQDGVAQDKYPLDGAYELIDGQQRLTTLWLIKSYLNNEEYGIYYELVRGVDVHYIKNAQETIKLWFEGRKKVGGRQAIQAKCKDIDKFREKLNNLFFIWYEVKDEKAEEIFNSVNDGKVPLTNAELFKALLLDENSNVKKQEDLVKIAYEWDKIEGNLRDDDFWAFISNDQSEEKTRIDYLLDVYAKALASGEGKDLAGDLDFHKERFSFLMTQRYKAKGNLSAKEIWTEIVKVYDKLYSWYKDDELYHTIGFLVACEEKSKGSKATASELICALYQVYKDTPLSEVRKEMKRKISETYFWYKQEEKKDEENEDGTKTSRGGKQAKLKPLEVDDVKYQYEGGTPRVQVDSKHLRAILLFSNIYAGYFQVANADEEKNPLISRFPFRLYKSMSWDIEHIRPKELKLLDAKKCSDEDIQSARDALLTEGEAEAYSKEDIPKIEIIKEGALADVKEDVISAWNNYKVTADHDLSNLVLLDANTNRQYGNAFFCRKRKDVISFDVKGRFIPLCTKRAFLKYFSTGSFNGGVCWTHAITADENNMSDKSGYNEYLTNMFKVVHGWRK